MSAATIAEPTAETLADLLERLGSLPPERIRMHPPPGTATERDVLANHGGTKRLCELVDGVLVEKAMGFYESHLAAVLIRLLGNFVERHDLGIVLAPDGTLRLTPGLVRIPDVSFISWDHFPNRRLPSEPIPDLAPDLAVDILSSSNTEQEMRRKLREYFAAAVILVWYADPRTRTVRCYTSPEDVTTLTESDTLDAAPVLPGFMLPVRDWFGQADDPRS